MIWNEVASAGWMDMSPFIPNRAGPNGSFPLSEAQFGLWVAKYADLVVRAAAARTTAGFTDRVMLWTSNDRLWERPRQRQGQPLHTGVRPFLDRLWPRLIMANVSFGTAVHPYDQGVLLGLVLRPMDSEALPFLNPNRPNLLLTYARMFPSPFSPGPHHSLSEKKHHSTPPPPPPPAPPPPLTPSSPTCSSR